MLSSFVLSLRRNNVNINRNVETRPASVNTLPPESAKQRAPVGQSSLLSTPHHSDTSRFDRLKFPKKPMMSLTESFSNEIGQAGLGLLLQFQQTRGLHKELPRRILKNGQNAKSSRPAESAKVHWAEETVFHEKKARHTGIINSARLDIQQTTTQPGARAPLTVLELTHLQERATETALYAGTATKRAELAITMATQAEARFYIANEGVTQARQKLQDLRRSPNGSKDDENAALSKGVSAITTANRFEDEWHCAVRDSVTARKKAEEAQVTANDMDARLKRALGASDGSTSALHP